MAARCTATTDDGRRPVNVRRALREVRRDTALLVRGGGRSRGEGVQAPARSQPAATVLRDDRSARLRQRPVRLLAKPFLSCPSFLPSVHPSFLPAFLAGRAWVSVYLSSFDRPQSSALLIRTSFGNRKLQCKLAIGAGWKLVDILDMNSFLPCFKGSDVLET